MNPGKTLELGLELRSAGGQSLGAQRALASNPVFQAGPFRAGLFGNCSDLVAEPLLGLRRR